MADNYFSILNQINVNEHTEKKGNLTYLSWAWAWGEAKKLHPDMTSRVYEADNGCLYHTDGQTAWVKVGVTISGIEYIEYLPVMDNRNNSIPVERITSRNASDSIQRALTKAIARHGLGLYIYAGEDLPDGAKDEPLSDDDMPFEFVRASRVPTITKAQQQEIGKLVKEVFGGDALSSAAFQAVTGFSRAQLAAMTIPATEYDFVISKLTLLPEDAKKVLEELRHGRTDA